MEGLLIALIVIVVIACLYFVIKFIISKSKKNSADKQIKKIKVKKPEVKKDDEEIVHLTLNNKYMYQKELHFFEALCRSLPRDYIAFPKVGVDRLVEPLGSKWDYESILSKYVDFVIFDKYSMKPVLVIDLYDDTYGDEKVSEQEPAISRALSAVKLKLLPIKVQKTYDLDQLKASLESALPEKITAGEN